MCTARGGTKFVYGGDVVVNCLLNFNIASLLDIWNTTTVKSQKMCQKFVIGKEKAAHFLEQSSQEAYQCSFIARIWMVKVTGK